MESLESEGLIESRREVVFRKDRHLASALIISEIQYMMKYKDCPRALKREHRELLEDMEKENWSIIHPQYTYSWFMNNYQKIVDSHDYPELSSLIYASKRATEVSVEEYTGVSCLYRTDIVSFLQEIYSVKTAFDDLFDVITHSSEFKKEWKLRHVRGTAYGNLHAIYLAETQQNPPDVVIITHAHLAGIRDMFNSWFDVLLYSSQNRGKYLNHDLYKEVENVIRLMSKFSKEHLHLMPDLIKIWPSLCIGSILRDIEDDPSFLDVVSSKFVTIAFSPIYQYMTRKIATTSDVHICLEMSGLWKCFGHPIIDMDSSVRSWVSKGSSSKLGLEDAGCRVENMFKLVFCRNYYKEKRAWPPVEYDDRTSSRVKRNIDKDTWDECSKFPWLSSEFEGMRLSTCLSFDMHVDISDLLADKSIIPCRSQWIHEYDKQVHRTLYGFFPTGPDPTSKSAVISFLETEEVSVEKIIKTIDSGFLPEEWKIIVAVAKEREQKRDAARWYAKMTPEMRLYQTATESNLAKQIFPYLPHQTMTLNEEQLLRLLLRMTSPKKTSCSDEFRYIVIFGAQSNHWCTNHRHELTAPTFRQIDNLFGFRNVYFFTQLFPIQSILLFQDRFSPPRQGDDGLPEEGTRCVRSFEAWMEGLRQKGWTIITLMLILLVAERCGTYATLMGQGDNQVVLMRMLQDSKLKELNMTSDEYVSWFVRELVKEADSCGLQIKGEETWRSRRLFEYSREYYYEGSQVSATLKRISRLSSESNQAVPTLSNDLSSLFSTGSAAAAKDHQPVTSYFCTCVEASYLLRRNMTWLRREPIEMTTTCLLTSRFLGGLPVGLYPSFCTRSVQDHLSVSLRLAKIMLRTQDLAAHAGKWINLRFSEKDMEALIKDPQCLPIRAPLKAESIIRREIKRGIQGVVKNKIVKAMFDANVDDQKNKLIDTLSSMTPLNPRLANKIYSLSNPGLQEKFVSKYANTRSIQRMACSTWVSEMELLDWVKRTQKSVSERYNSHDSYDECILNEIRDSPCTTQLSHKLRLRGWGQHLEGVTMPSQSEQSTVMRWEQVPDSWKECTILLHVDDTLTSLYPPPKGKRQPYFGAMTRMRARKAPLQILEIGSMVSSLKQTLETMMWLRDSPDMVSLMTVLLKEKTDLDILALNKYARKVYSGTISHRLDAPSLRRGGMCNQTSNVPSHIKIVSDTATRYAKQGENYTICFQSVFLHAISVITQLAHMGVCVKGAWGIVLSCEQCTSHIKKEMFTLAKQTYEGVTLPIFVSDITPKITAERIMTAPNTGNEVEAYTVHVARKFVLWDLSISHRDRITSMTNRHVEDEYLISQINLAEFVHVDMKLFMRMISYYYILFGQERQDTLHNLSDKLLSSSAEKTPFDSLLDTMAKCELLGDLAGFSNITDYSRYTQGTTSLRGLLHSAFMKIIEEGLDKLILLTSKLTAEDTISTYKRAITYLVQTQGYIDLPPDGTREDIDEWLEFTYSDVQCQIKPYIVMDEEKAVVYIRSLDRHNVHIRGVVPMSSSSFLSSSEILTPVTYRYFNPTTISLKVYTLLHILNIIKSCFPPNLHLVTVNDDQGECYAAINHVLTILSGYPIWYHDDPSSSLDKGPLHCVLETCNTDYRYHDRISSTYDNKIRDPCNIIVVQQGRVKLDKESSINRVVIFRKIIFSQIIEPHDIFELFMFQIEINSEDEIILFIIEKLVPFGN